MIGMIDTWFNQNYSCSEKKYRANNEIFRRFGIEGKRLGFRQKKTYPRFYSVRNTNHPGATAEYRLHPRLFLMKII